jgi:hypothetical protein
MMKVLKWVEGEPPRSRSRSGADEYLPIRLDLASQPGRWAQLETTATETEARSLVMKLRHKGYRFAFRTLAEDEYGVYGKYEGV